MKRFAIALILFSSYCSAQTPGEFQPASTNVWGADYPRVNAKGQAEFRIKAPNATAVKLNFWSNPKLDMVKGPDGVWTATTPPLVPGFHYYNFVVDDVDVNYAGSHAFYGGSMDASAEEIPEPGATYYLPQDVPHGAVRQIWYFSKVSGRWRHAVLYLPPGYDTQTKLRYPVLYLQLGGGDEWAETRESQALDGWLWWGQSRSIAAVS